MMKFEFFPIKYFIYWKFKCGNLHHYKEYSRPNFSFLLNFSAKLSIMNLIYYFMILSGL